MVSQKEIGSFIAELRKEKQLTQCQLGERLGVTNKTVSRWENGNYMPDARCDRYIANDTYPIDTNEI